MTTIAVGTDNIRGRAKDAADLETFCSKLRSAGYDVKSAGVGPNTVQRYAGKNNIDMMVQIAGGLCIGTLGDFIAGIKRGYYHAKKGAIVYNMVANKLDAKTWKAVKAWDWSYSMSTVTPYLGKTLPQVYSENKDTLIGFADGKSIDEVTTNFLKVLGGGTSTGETITQTQGSSILEYIKQVCSDLDPYGVELDLQGDTLHVHKSQISQAKPLDTSRIVNNSMSYVDYDSNTPNSNGSAKDQYLIDRFGEIPLDATVEDEQAQVLQISQRGHGHSIDVKTLLSQDYIAGQWVKLTLPELGINQRPYYISKNNVDEELTSTLTLEPGPPSLYVEVMEETTEEENTDETDETLEE